MISGSFGQRSNTQKGERKRNLNKFFIVACSLFNCTTKRIVQAVELTQRRLMDGSLTVIVSYQFSEREFSCASSIVTPTTILLIVCRPR